MIFDKYTPIPETSNECDSMNEFACDGITPSVYHQSEKRVSWEVMEAKGLIPSFRGANRTIHKRKSSLVSFHVVKKFIMLDDSQLNLLVLKAAILKLKPTAIVLDFSSPENILSFLKEDSFENSHLVFFLDIELSSEITGFQVAHFIKGDFLKGKENTQIQVISYSSHSGEVIASQSSDFDGFLPKPFKESQIVKVFHALCL